LAAALRPSPKPDTLAVAPRVLTCGGYTPRPQEQTTMLNIKEPLDQRVTIRLTQTEKNILIEEADLAGLTTAELIRRRYFGKPIIAATDAATIRELRRTGGLLKHIFNQSDANNQKVGTEILTTLNEVRECIKRIANRDRQES
jgi:SpoVK/Ycf46/Vps4 family AAA+-type ATPase